MDRKTIVIKFIQKSNLKNCFYSIIQKIAAQFEKWYCTGCFCSKTAQQTTVCTFERKQI